MYLRQTGKLPSQFPPAVRNLFLRGNSLTGNIPDLLPATLIEFNAANNKLGGGFPTSLASMQALEFVDLQHNLLTGSIPDVWSTPVLRHLDISDNAFSGVVVAPLCQQPALEYLDTTANRLSCFESECRNISSDLGCPECVPAGDDEDDKLSDGAIAGVVIASVVVAGGITGGLFMLSQAGQLRGPKTNVQTSILGGDQFQSENPMQSI